MKSETINISDPSGKYYMFYSAPALLSNHHREREFGTVIAESKNKLIIVDDENIRDHIYLIPKAKVDHCSQKQVHFKIQENSLNEFEI
jgi:hypothetical protein